MKAKQKLELFAGSAGMTTLVAILLSAKDQLIVISPWVVDTMIACAGSALLYGAYRGAMAVGDRWQHSKNLRLDVQAKEQQLQLERERHEWEVKAIQADIHVKTGRVYADPNGNYPIVLPTVVDMLPEHLQYQIMSFNPGQAKGIGTRQNVPALPSQADSLQDEQETIGEQDIPANVRYEDIRHQIPRGSSCLGVSRDGLETCDFKDLMTMLICGGSSTGKTNTVAIKLKEAMEIGHNTHMIVIDPHKTKPDSLYNKTRQYERRFLTPVAQKDDAIIQALTWFKDEFNRRMQLPTEELEQLDDVLLICDEVFSLVFHRDDDRIAKLIKLVSGIAGYESRGYGMYAWFLTQKVTGLKWLRDAVMTTICHKMQTMSERVLASNGDTKVARDMDNWTMKGRVVVFGLSLPVTVTQMPLLTVVEGSVEPADEMEPLQQKKALPISAIVDFQAEQWKRSGNGREAAQEKAGKDTDELNEENAVTLKKMLQDIREKRTQGRALNTILREDYGINGGRAHQEIKQLLEIEEA